MRFISKIKNRISGFRCRDRPYEEHPKGREDKMGFQIRQEAILSPQELHQKAIRSMLLIAAMGLALMIADALLSSSGDMIADFDERSGQIYLIRPDSDRAASHMSVRARVKTKKGSYEKDLDLTLSPYMSEEAEDIGDVASGGGYSEEEQISYQLRSIASDLDSDTSRRQVILPQRLPGGESISWSRRKSNHVVLILAATIAFVALIYRNRNTPAEKVRKKQRESINEGLPVLLHQVVLLMNAGLIPEEAFEKASQDNTRFSGDDPGFFFSTIRRIQESVSNTNAVFHKELLAFAKTSGVSELLRISTIISDNVNRGTEMVEKLEEESRALWLDRRSKCEERGRLAETEMTLPLTIFLGVLILITISPALLDMNR